ncbi:response regulator [Enterococcus faecium]
MMTNVLIIEDDPMVAELNRTFVESIPNMNVIESFRNVEEGKNISDKKTQICCCLMYICLAKVVSIFLSWLRQQGNDIPVILITAADDIETIKNVIRYGALDYLIKPFTLQRFQLAIEKYLAFSQTIQTTEKADQKLIDQVFNHTTPIHETPSFIDLPKGLSKLTLKKSVHLS